MSDKDEKTDEADDDSDDDDDESTVNEDKIEEDNESNVDEDKEVDSDLGAEDEDLHEKITKELANISIHLDKGSPENKAQDQHAEGSPEKKDQDKLESPVDDPAGKSVDSKQPTPEGDVLTEQPKPGEVETGLRSLIELDHVLVQSEYNITEVILPYEGPNKFSVVNNRGQKILYAVEETDFCWKQVCGRLRPWTVHVCDVLTNPVLHIERRLSSGSAFSGWTCCRPDTVVVKAESGKILGVMMRKPGPMVPAYGVMSGDKPGEIMLLRGPCCLFMLLTGVTSEKGFTITSVPDGEFMGTITKDVNIVMREKIAGANNFRLRFPVLLDMEKKAVLLGALFLVSFNYC